jgi:hypothetical protein
VAHIGDAPVTADNIRKLLRRNYGPPAFALLEEVGNATGFDSNRHIDAIAMGLWPSRGLDVSGFEIKVSVGDWRRELKSPEKAEAIQRYCDYWWIVAPKGVVPIETVPANWGLMEATERTLKAKKVAPKLSPQPITREFLAAMLKRTGDWAAQIANNSTRFQEGREAGREERRYEIEKAKRDAADLRENVSRFQEASGVVIDRWNSGNVGDAVRLVLSGRHLDRIVELRRLADFLEANLESVRREIAPKEEVVIPEKKEEGS